MLRLEVEVVVDVGKPREIRAYSAHRKALRAARSTVFGCFFTVRSLICSGEWPKWAKMKAGAVFQSLESHGLRPQHLSVMARGNERRFQYMWGDAGSSFHVLAQLNPMRWSRLMQVGHLIEELQGSERPVKIYMCSKDESLSIDFATALEATEWLRENFAEDLAQPQAAQQAAQPFFSCLRPPADEHELDLGEPTEVTSHSEPEAVTPDSCHGLAEGEVKVQYMWADAKTLPLMQELSRQNPLRWSTPCRPAQLAEQLDTHNHLRAVRLAVETSRGKFQRNFESSRAAAQWLRKSFLNNSTETLDEERLCVICLTEPRNVMLMPCRHAVLCEGCLEQLLQTQGAACPICRTRVLNHARGYFVNDYVELVQALEMRLERSQTAAYQGPGL